MTLIPNQTKLLSGSTQALREQEGSFSERWQRKIAHQVFSRLQHGSLILVEGSTRMQWGDATEETVEMTVHSPRFYRRLMLGGSLGAAESYIQGEWSTPDLTKLFRMLSRNFDNLEKLDGGMSLLARVAARVKHWIHRNSRSGSRKNIQAHYDLGNDLFELMLDESMMYSSGIFPTAESTLAEASETKLRTICEKLQLTSEDHVVEIGTGWGGFACFAAKHYGCRVTTTTISREQHEYASQRVQREGLQDRITLLFQDYRDLTGTYDKLVSIEMIEAVGERYLSQYLRKCQSLLKPAGEMLLQAIVMPEQRYEQYRRSVDFIQTYVFPGGFLPSVQHLQSLMGAETDFRLLHLEDFAPHYARTLEIWEQRFHAGWEQLQGRGYPMNFRRMWDYYLAYCRAAFEERLVGVVQLVAARPQSRLDVMGSFRSDRS